MSDPVDKTVTSTDDAQSTIQMAEGDLSDIDTALDDEAWAEALETIDEAIERLQAVRIFVATKAEN